MQERQQYAKEKKERELAELKQRLLFLYVCEILYFSSNGDKPTALSLKYVHVHKYVNKYVYYAVKMKC